MATDGSASQRGKRSHDTITNGDSAAMEPPAKRARVSSAYLVDFLDSTKYPPIRDVLVKCLDVRSMTRLCATSRHLRRSIRSREWNIKRFLSHHFDDPVQFRLAQSRSAALIIGDAAFRFIEGRLHTGILHMIVEVGQSYNRLFEYLTGTEKYVAGPRTTMYSGSVPLNSHSSMFLGKGDKTINLIISSPPAHVSFVQMQTTTASAAALTWDKAYHIFPRTTFDDFQTMPFRPLTEQGLLKQDGIIEHRGLSDRGWSVKVPPSAFFAPPRDKSNLSRELCSQVPPEWVSPLVLGCRRVGDHLSFKLALDITGVSPGSAPDKVLASSSFEIQVPNSPAPANTFWNQEAWRMHCPLVMREFSSPSLRHTYCISPSMLLDDNRLLIDALTLLLYELTLPQIVLLDSLEQDRVFGQIRPDPVALTRITFKQPSWWNFYDHVVEEHILKAEQFMLQARTMN